MKADYDSANSRAPYRTANPISRLFHWWTNGLFMKGFKKDLEPDDLYQIPRSEEADVLGDRVERHWRKELKVVGRSPSIGRAFAKTFLPSYMCQGIILVVVEACSVAQPLLFQQLILYFSGSDMPRSSAYLYAAAVGGTAILMSMLNHWYIYFCRLTGTRMRTAGCTIIYRKILRINSAALANTTIGQIVNVLSNDVCQLEFMTWFGHWLILGPVVTVVVFYIVYTQLGVSVLAGIGVIISILAFQVYLGKRYSKHRLRQLECSDERVKLMNEIIGGIRVLKMYCWEIPFSKIVGDVRQKELVHHWRCRRLSALISELYVFNTRFITAVTVVMYLLLEKDLSAAKVFPTISLISIVNEAVLDRCAWGVKTWLETKVSFDRIQKILMLEELPIEETTPDNEKSTDKAGISIENLTATWDKTSTFSLKNINLELGPGELVAVIGPVGAGKSSLVMALLREMVVSSGSTSVKGSVAYASQEPWVYSGTLRNNILFGLPFKESRFREVIMMASLKKDINALPNGDQTLVGERGVTLSGGQKARVNLARALYRDADVYLLDDPLSAVDSHVGRHMFEKCILKGLSDKSRLLVTHQLQYMKDCDRIIILDEGSVIAIGTYEELIESGVEFSKLLSPQEEPEENEKKELSRLERQFSRQTSQGGPVNLESFEAADDEEDRRSGAVKWKVYRDYFLAGAGCLGLLFLMSINILTQCIYAFADWWLSKWSNDEENQKTGNSTSTNILYSGNTSRVNLSDLPHVNWTKEDTSDDSVYDYTNAVVYCCLTMAIFIVGCFRGLMFWRLALRIGIRLHSRMFNSILRAPVHFFDTNPVGRILNRFSSDSNVVDGWVPDMIYDFNAAVMIVLGNFFLIVVVNPWVLVPSLPLFVLVCVTRTIYVRTTRDISRIGNIARSPIYSHLSASIQGLQVIRAFKAQERCSRLYYDHVNRHSEAEYTGMWCYSWFSFRVEFAGALFVTAVAFMGVLYSSEMNAGLVGLIMATSLQLMWMLQNCMRLSADIEVEMASVERIMEYTKLMPEAGWKNECKLHKDWPESGRISMKHLKFGYSLDTPDVLKDISCEIRGGEKIGIVGRTGAGKSSIIQALFRLAEPRGQITIDGIDVLRIGLHDVREKLSIIPQDPVLFSGTMRRNLDPFDDHSDKSLWNALDQVQLKEVVSDLPGKLEANVAEGGINFSVGQKQLVCLARAVLRKNRILILDEATANVDRKTDDHIQETIREKFADCTVLTIAHRLNTIMDSDRIMVLDHGEIKQFDTPYKLLQDQGGILHKLVEETGKGEKQRLFSIAKKIHDMKRNTSTSLKLLSTDQTIIYSPPIAYLENKK